MGNSIPQLSAMADFGEGGKKMEGGSIAAIVFGVVLTIVLIGAICMSLRNRSGCGCMYGSSFRPVQAGDMHPSSFSAAALGGGGGSSVSGWLGQPQRVIGGPAVAAVDSPVTAGCPRVPDWARNCAGACATSMRAARQAHDQAASAPPPSVVCAGGFTAVETDVLVNERVEYDEDGKEIQRFDRLLLASVPLQGSAIRQMRTRFSGDALVTLTADLRIPGRGIVPLYRGRAITANLRVPELAIPAGTTLEVRATARDSATNTAAFKLQYEACM